jgi:hypothetical protein
MKKKIFLYISFLMVISCRHESKKSCNAPLNPNGDSELALLMRKMMTSLENEKTNVVDGKFPGEFPADFMRIKTATPSDSKALGGNFNAFADQYISSLREYYNSKTDFKLHYNNLVRSCINCHNDECPGPVKHIEKLLVP